jgi:SAM-dependent methyltransferase
MADKPQNDSELLETNRSFYDSLWRDARLVEPELFNTWPLVRELVAAAKGERRLEVAPGLRPRLPIAGTRFVDISPHVAKELAARGGEARVASVHDLPFPDQAFDLVCALDIIEHVDNDDRAMSELARVAAPGAVLLLSTPLHPRLWTGFDEFVGHRRRYEPEQIRSLLLRHGFSIERSAIFGMQPRSSFWLDLGLWFLNHFRDRAMWGYNKVMPLIVRRQKPLRLRAGLANTEGVDEVLLVCHRKQP